MTAQTAKGESKGGPGRDEKRQGVNRNTKTTEPVSFGHTGVGPVTGNGGVSEAAVCGNFDIIMTHHFGLDGDGERGTITRCE